jgi:hypothetical protein
MLEVEDTRISATLPLTALAPVPVYQESVDVLLAALKATRPIYVALIDGVRDDCYFYGSRAVIEQFPVEGIVALAETVEALKRRYNNDGAAEFGFATTPWLAIVITLNPTSPSIHCEPLGCID